LFNSVAGSDAQLSALESKKERTKPAATTVIEVCIATRSAAACFTHLTCFSHQQETSAPTKRAVNAATSQVDDELFAQIATTVAASSASTSTAAATSAGISDAQLAGIDISAYIAQNQSVQKRGLFD
jgi:hypothetical protein